MIRPYVELILKLINSIFFIISITTLLYGLNCLFKWKQSLTKPHFGKPKYLIPAAPFLLAALDPSNSLSDKLPLAWFIYLVLAMGAILFLIACFGFVGTAARSPCCLCSYSVLLVGLVLAEVGVAALVFFSHNPNEVFPSDTTGNLNSSYQFLSQNWKIIRWIALATLTLEVIAVLLSLYLRYVNQAADDNTGNEKKISVIHPDFRLRKAGIGKKSSTANSAPSTSTDGRNTRHMRTKKTTVDY